MRHTESTTIDATTAEVWALVGDPRGWPGWLHDVSEVELPSDDLAAGSEFSYEWRGRDVHATVSTYKSGETIAIATSESNYDFGEMIAVQPSGGRTRVTFTMEFEPTVWWARALSVLLVPFKSLLLGRPLRKELESLRIAVEKAAG